MISFTLTGQARILKNLSTFQGIDNVVKLWMDSGQVDQIMSDSFTANFEKEGRPKWQELAEITRNTRESKGFGSGPILHETGNLMDEVTSLRGSTSTFFGGVSKEWGVDQLRGEEQIKFRAHQTGVRSSGKTIPKRPMIGFQPEDSKMLIRSLSSWIFKQLQ